MINQPQNVSKQLPAAQHHHRWHALLAISVLIATGVYVAVVASRLFDTMSLQLQSRTDLAVENPTLVSILLLKHGENLYAVHDRVPFHVMLYTPLYHCLVAILPTWADEPYRMARLVSAIFMFLAVGLLFVRPRSVSSTWIAAVLVAFFFSCIAVGLSTVLARQDSMALFLSAASVMLLACRKGTAACIASAALAVAAIATKQSFLAAPLAGLIYLATSDRLRLRVYVMTLASLGLAGSALASIVWGRDFWWSTLVAPSASFAPLNYPGLWSVFSAQFTYRLFTMVMLASLLLPLFDLSSRFGLQLTSRRNAFWLYACTSITVMLLTLSKEGAGPNYFFEPTLAGLLLLQDQLLALRATRKGRSIAMLLGAALAACFVIELATIPPMLRCYSTPEQAAHQYELVQALRSEAADLGLAIQPGNSETIFVSPSLTNPTVFLHQIPVLSDRFLYSILWREHKLDQRSLVEAIDHRNFSAVLMAPGSERAAMHEPMLDDAFYESLAANYAFVRTGLYDYYLPRREPAVRSASTLPSTQPSQR